MDGLVIAKMKAQTNRTNEIIDHQIEILSSPICIWVNFWQFQDSWIFEECWMWWQELGQRQMGCQGWPGGDAAICMMITRSAHSGALVTIRQCICHNGLGPGQEERGLRTVSHRNPENLLPYGWKWVLNKLLTCERWGTRGQFWNWLMSAGILTFMWYSWARADGILSMWRCQ